MCIGAVRKNDEESPHVAVEIDRKKLQPREELAVKNEGKSADQKVDEKTPLLPSSSGNSKTTRAEEAPSTFSTPSIQLVSFSVDRFDVDVAVPDAQRTAHWNITFFLRNPYMAQPKETKLVSAAVVSSATVVSKKIVNAFVAERSRTGAVSFDVEIFAKVLEKGGWDGNGYLFFVKIQNLGFLSIVKS
ncbi:unnamed protein product [Prunus armeniaca]|uniref:Uncharacterized protein n=1 Tax=Prunus armeniaca TaxID=36596 RepID=A0A6J5XHR9_PRUAR|nr:unnamed protein product [Prunus armeniaca]CAB4313476.1 unnamed protein product [Prunus armeniaca]